MLNEFGFVGALEMAALYPTPTYSKMHNKPETFLRGCLWGCGSSVNILTQLVLREQVHRKRQHCRLIRQLADRR